MRRALAAAVVSSLLLVGAPVGRCLAAEVAVDTPQAQQAQDAPAKVPEAGAPSGPARPEPKPPYLAMRELEQLQDRIAAGDAAAAAARPKAIARTAALFAATKLAAWGEARNARALVLYLFSGGDAAAVARAIPRPGLPKGLADLYEGALGYGLGDDARARKALAAIDPKGLPPALGGHLALVQAALVAEPARAIERLDLARLLAPGTLVEEAALRKEMGLIDARRGDLPKFALLARRYAATFSRSVYYANFRQLVRQQALALVQPEGGASEAGAGVAEAGAAAGRLALVVGALDPRDRRRLLLAIARDALMAGRMAMAAAVAEQLIAPAGDGRPDGKPDGRVEADRARALVYFGAATIVGPRHEAARLALAGAADPRLDADDEALRLAALSVEDTIRDPAFAAPPSRGEADAAAIRDGERSLDDARLALAAAATRIAK